MSALIIVQPVPITSVTSSRGSGAANLRTRDPKEIWADSAVGSVTFQIDLGQVRGIDTIYLGYLAPVAAAATWSIKGGVASADEAVFQALLPLHTADLPEAVGGRSHALWFGTVQTARYIAITLTQPAGVAPLTAGVLVIGRAFAAELGHEWGAGRQPIDTGSVTSLPSGGFAIVEGVRKLVFSWSFGDLSFAEADQLELIALALGETSPGLVVESPDVPAGLRRRIHYGLFKPWKMFERRNRRQTRWEVAIEDWV